MCAQKAGLNLFGKLFYLCIMDTQILINNMVICVHIIININNGLPSVKVLGKKKVKEVFFFRNQSNTPVTVKF